jgi:Subtilase family
MCLIFEQQGLSLGAAAGEHFSMMYPPGAGPDREETEAAIARELARLQPAIAELAYQQDQLAQQQFQLQQLLAGYNHQIQLARQGDQEDRARYAWEQQQRLLPQFYSVQQELAALQREREPLDRYHAALLAQLNALRGGQTIPGPDAADWPPPDQWTYQPPPPARQNSRPLLLLLSGLVLLVVLAPLALLFLQHTSSAPTGQNNPVASPTPKPTPTEQPPAYAAAGTAPTNVQCQNIIHTPCYSPQQIQQAFSLTSLYKQGYDGHGQTIVILGVGNTTSLKNDLHQFDLAWGLPDPKLTILHPFGMPAPYFCGDGVDDLALEDTLDVEWAHAIAPGANITLLIGSNDSGGTRADNCSFVGLQEAIAYAVDHHLGSVITMSYGGSELGAVSETASEKAQDRRYFNRAHAIFERAVKAGITILASSGDSGVTNPDGGSPTSVWNRPNVNWPASDPDVLAVGGTQLVLQDDGGGYGSEAVWNVNNGATGGGLSDVFPEPDYQKVVPDQTIFQGKRGIPDVAFPAAVNYELYGSFLNGQLGLSNTRWTHWDVIGGTSASAPCWAGLIAIANQMRGEPLGLIQPALYRLQGQAMHDITSGDNSMGGVQGYQAQIGYDLVSGWGTPIADHFLPDLIQATDHTGVGCPNPKIQCL